MSTKRLVDTNVILRHLVQDHPEHAKTAKALFEASDRGDVTLHILPSVLAECVFVLESFYERSRQSIAAALSQLIASPGIEVEHADIHADALRRFVGGKLHFVDCVIAAFAAARSLEVASFERGFNQFSDVKVNVKG